MLVMKKYYVEYFIIILGFLSLDKLEDVYIERYLGNLFLV